MEHAGFLADIVAHPDEDAPRLIYADWLDEHGGRGGAARAEFIRVQCELARLEPEPADPFHPHGMGLREAESFLGNWCRSAADAGLTPEVAARRNELLQQEQALWRGNGQKW